MSKRIKEMWTVVCKEEMPELDETCMTLQRQKKFAELIVQECMTVGFNAVYVLEDDSKAVAVYQSIKEHFGVDE